MHICTINCCTVVAQEVAVVFCYSVIKEKKCNKGQSILLGHLSPLEPLNTSSLSVADLNLYC